MDHQPLRTRGRRNAETLDGHFWSRIGPVSIDGPASAELLRMEEFMQDTVGFPHCDYNPVFHDKAIYGFEPVSSVIRPAGYGDTELQFSGGVGLLPPSLVEAFRGLTPLPEQMWLERLDDFAVRARRHMIEAIQDGPSVVNFLLELYELLQGGWKRYFEIRDSLAKAWELFMKSWRKHPGNFWLAWNFAIKPMMSDVRKFLSQIEHLKKRLKWLEKQNHKLTRTRYREQPYEWSGSFELNPSYPEGDPPYVEWADLVCRVDYEAKARLCAWGDVKWDIPDWVFRDSRALFLAALDFNWIFNPLRILWEAVPFSWLLDWFVGERAKDQHENVEFSPFVDGVLHQSGHSLKVELNATVKLLDHVTGIQYDIGFAKYELYTRRPGLPSRDVSPFRVPSEWYNFSLLASIVAQRKG